jgi:four helix bundle protein
MESGSIIYNQGMGEYKFQSLFVYQLALDYVDQVYDLVSSLPDSEKYNLSSQLIRAATSIALNIAEGSTGQSNKEQVRFLSLSLRSYLETVACLDLIQRRDYISPEKIIAVRKTGRNLFYKMTRFRKVLQR